MKKQTGCEICLPQVLAIIDKINARNADIKTFGRGNLIDGIVELSEMYEANGCDTEDNGERKICLPFAEIIRRTFPNS